MANSAARTRTSAVLCRHAQRASHATRRNRDYL